MSDILKYLPNISGAYRQNAKLVNWFDVGGLTDIVFRPKDYNDLQNFLKEFSKQNIPLNVIGAGSNVIISDEGIRGVVIKLPASFAAINHDENFITIGAAALCGGVASYVKNNGLANLEFLTGIPGSIGGAIAMNAGCYGSDISQILVKAYALDFFGKSYEISNSEFGFFYRGNSLPKNLIFTSATFKYQKSNPLEVSKAIEYFNLQRESSQPIRAKTGGSTFKNPSHIKAWQLIDQAGCRGKSIGDAQISEKHCNFMINRGNAFASDLINLGNEVRDLVYKNSGVKLEWEIKILK